MNTSKQTQGEVVEVSNQKSFFIWVQDIGKLNPKTTKYFIYARKSSEGEDRQVTSIEDQISEMKKLAKELNIEIVGIISESKSAKEPGRKGFNELLKRIKKGEAQGILCWKLNRLARNSIDGGSIIHLLQKNNIQHIQTYGRDYKPTDNVIMMYVEFGMANQYSNDLSVDVKRGYRKKAERGWYPVTRLPVGYMHNSQRHQLKGADEIIPNPKSYSIIKKLWKILLTGLYSISDIKREGDSLGLINSKGNAYSISSYHYIFSNEFYCGIFYWNDGNGNKMRHIGKHKPMISMAEFHKVQEVYRKNSKPTRKRKYTFPYRGLIACGECNGFVTAENKHQAICTHCKYKFSLKTKSFCPKCKTDISKMKNPSIINKTYYHCTKKIKKNCSQGSITDVKIEEFIIENLKDITIHKDFFNFSIMALKRLKIEEKKDDNLLRQLKKRKTELSQRLSNLIQMRADNEITKEQLEQMQHENLKKIKSLEIEISYLDFAHTNWLKVANEQLNFALHSLKKFKKGDKKTKKAIASKIGSNLTLKDKSLYFKRVKALFYIKNCSNKYIEEIGRLEPNIDIENKGNFNSFDPLFSVLREHLTEIRTCQIDNILNK